MQSIGFGMQLMFYVSIGLGFIYAAMRFYMYIILVTFKLNTYKIIKNSFIFALLGIKRNLLAFIGILLTISINYFFYMMFPPIGVVMPFIITFSLCAFISAYAVYPIIKKYMIIPYYPDADKQPESDVEPVFVDRG
ncbi:hypothetical protein SDC9_116427 [bioreactor metagenome]|uniref:Uncharacterized protein n=1 Tax=bioreactor metagenome TaxID=1076179 RepID=A0A645BW30_9ZZZZ